MKILLISGHGATDSGAVGNGYKEADLTRELVNMIAVRLRDFATVTVYNQARNAFVDCKYGIFNARGYDYVLEVHFNASNGSGHGTECYVTTLEKGIGVEQKIMKNMGKYFRLRDNDSIFDGVKRTNFLVIKTCKKRGMSGALLEVCFIDNKNDMTVYQANKNRIADGIVSGIADGFGLKKVENPEKPHIPVIPANPEIEYYKAFNSVSIVDGLKSIGVDNSMTNRKKIAAANGIKGYTGTAGQNKKLTDLARAGKLKKV